MDDDQNELMERSAVVVPRRADLQQALRYVLIHDLGLTREAIRSDSMSFVEETVREHFANLSTKREIEALVSREFSNLLRRKDYGSLEALVNRITERVVGRYVKEHLRFEVLDAEKVGALADEAADAKGGG